MGIGLHFFYCGTSLFLLWYLTFYCGTSLFTVVLHFFTVGLHFFTVGLHFKKLKKTIGLHRRKCTIHENGKKSFINCPFPSVVQQV